MKDDLLIFLKNILYLFCSTGINVAIRKNISEIILLSKFTLSWGESWKALVNGHHQVENSGYTSPKQSSFRQLTLLSDLETLKAKIFQQYFGFSTCNASWVFQIWDKQIPKINFVKTESMWANLKKYWTLRLG